MPGRTDSPLQVSATLFETGAVDERLSPDRGDSLIQADTRGWTQRDTGGYTRFNGGPRSTAHEWLHPLSIIGDVKYDGDGPFFPDEVGSPIEVRASSLVV